MLVLSRKPGEQTIINGNIVVKVIGISGNQVKLGFSAPKEISIVREEIQYKYSKEK